MDSDVSIPFREVVRITLKSSPRGLEMFTALRRGLSAGIIILSNTLGLSKEYVMPCEKPQNSAISLASPSMRSL